MKKKEIGEMLIKAIEDAKKTAKENESEANVYPYAYGALTAKIQFIVEEHLS